MGTDVITRSFDFARTGANTAETELSPTAVRTRGVKQVLTLQTPDDPRLEAQPLYLAAINIHGKTRNVVYQATMGNTVYAWDADTGELLWKTTVGTPINGVQAIDAHDINIKWGILSTPVIDRAVGVIYACAWISPDKSGNWQTAEHFVVALDITTGATFQVRRRSVSKERSLIRVTVYPRWTFAPSNANSGPRWPWSKGCSSSASARSRKPRRTHEDG